MTEFAEFIRDTGIHAVDTVSERTADFAAPVRSVLRAWAKLSEEQKLALFDALIATTLPDAPAPQKRAAKRTSSKKTSKKTAKKR